MQKLWDMNWLPRTGAEVSYHFIPSFCSLLAAWPTVVCYSLQIGSLCKLLLCPPALLFLLPIWKNKQGYISVHLFKGIFINRIFLALDSNQLQHTHVDKTWVIAESVTSRGVPANNFCLQLSKNSKEVFQLCFRFYILYPGDLPKSWIGGPQSQRSILTLGEWSCDTLLDSMTFFLLLLAFIEIAINCPIRIIMDSWLFAYQELSDLSPYFFFNNASDDSEGILVSPNNQTFQTCPTSSREGLLSQLILLLHCQSPELLEL